MSGIEQRAKQVARQVLHGLGRASAEQGALLERLARDVATLNARMDRVVDELRAEFGDRSPERSASAPAGASTGFLHGAPTFAEVVRSIGGRSSDLAEDAADRAREHYLDLLSTTGDPDLPVVDLTCARGGLVEMLAEAGVTALGVDGELFDWLDARPDGSVRSLTAVHVCEYLPPDLQVRLVFEAHRVVAPGGVLVVEVADPAGAPAGAAHPPTVHPRMLELLAVEAGFVDVEVRLLGPTGAADVAVVARR